MAFTFLICPDAELILEEARKRLAPGFSLRSFWGDEPLPDRFWQQLTIPPLGEAGCGVLLRQAHLAPAEVWSRLDALLRQGRPGIHPFFALEVDWEWSKKERSLAPKIPQVVRKAKCFAAATQRGWVWSHPGLSRAQAEERARAILAAAGKAIAPEARRLLQEHLPLSAAAIAAEMDKVLLAAGDSPTITPEHLQSLTGAPTWDVFALMQAALNPARAEELWRQLRHDPQMASGEATFGVLALVRREARILWLLTRGEDPGVRLPAAVLKAKQALAQRLGPSGTARLFLRVAEAETAIKSGRLRPAQALEHLLDATSQP
jgi:DNA polymerase-3 subunit delta